MITIKQNRLEPFLPIKGEGAAISPEVSEPVLPAQPRAEEKPLGSQVLRDEWSRIRDQSLTRSLKSAASLFKGVYFPPNLLDTQASHNNPKYMRLLAAVLGMEDVEDYFTIDGDDEGESDSDFASADESEEDDEGTA